MGAVVGGPVGKESPIEVLTKEYRERGVDIKDIAKTFQNLDAAVLKEEGAEGVEKVLFMVRMVWLWFN